MSDDNPSNDGTSGLPPQGGAGPSAAGPTGAGSTSADAKPVGGARKRKGVIRRHPILISLVVVLALAVGSAGGYLYWLNHQLDNITRIPVGIKEDPKRPEGAKDESQPLNILLLGADHGEENGSVADDLKDGKWTPFAHLSDTIMIAHIPADRDSVQLVSIPRDTWVRINGYPSSDHHAKINAAFSYGGPELAVKTVQQLTGIHIDHLAIIDWAGFKDLTSALDGVKVYIPETFYDDSQRITWKKGWQKLEGQEALAYVRTRHGLTNGDFDRIARQQNFMRATMGKLLSKTHNIVSMTKVINVVTKYLTVDETWSNSQIRNLALSLRNIHSEDVQFLTAPLGKYDYSSDGQSIVRLEPKQSRLLFANVENDRIDRYLAKYPDSALKGDKAVS